MKNTPELPLFNIDESKSPLPSYSDFSDDIIIAFVAPIGVDLNLAEKAAKKRLDDLGYNVHSISVTKDVFPNISSKANQKFDSQLERFWVMMDIGSDARKKYGTDIIALGIASEIRKHRNSNKSTKNNAFIIHSLKHPDEVIRLRELYPRGFYLFGVHSSPKNRENYLIQLPGIGKREAEKLMKRDRREAGDSGQQLVNTYYLSDFFIGWESYEDENLQEKSEKLLANSIDRIIDIVFGYKYHTPTFGEYAMFLAFSTAARSADLSRQVGAVIARDGEILSVGANDCPCYGGGLYWPKLDMGSLKFEDFPNGRDHKRSIDSNKREQIKIVNEVVELIVPAIVNNIETSFLHEKMDELQEDIISKKLTHSLDRAILKNSKIGDLTEFGRVVHAEMEALMSCARAGISTKGATLYSTTFPCHNCAKHIIASGIARVVFIEPYLKSLAIEFHKEAAEIAYPALLGDNVNTSQSKVKFEPFFGVGPRKYFDLFSMHLSSGYPMDRKDKLSGQILKWDPRIRVPMINNSYIDRERSASERFNELMSNCKKTDAVPLKGVVNDR